MNYSPIIDELFIGTTPLTQDYDVLRDLNVGLVINMRIERRPYPDHHNPPMRTLWLPSIDSPILPIPLRKLRKGSLAALETIESGRAVYSHCASGKHRGVAMGAAILIALGYDPETAMELIKDRRHAADPDAWYIKRQIVRFANTWDKYKASEK